MWGKEEEYVLDALRSGWVSSIGKYVEDFETRFAAFCGTKHALTASNGTTALHLALAAAGIGPGDEVIVPDITFIATANAVAYTGAKPVIVDVEADTLCICPAAARRAVSPRTRAILPVHLYGHPADMDPLLALAKEFGLVLIEDAAEAHGAEYKGKRVGGFGLAGVFSFYGNKIMTTGEGGMITTNDDACYEKARLLRDQAMSKTKRYWHDVMGFNYRMTNIQAALGVAQLERIEDLLSRREAILEKYRNAIETSESVRLNFTANWAKSAYWMVCLEVDWFREELRDEFMRRLRDKGVDSRPYFYPMSAMPMYKAITPPVAARKAPIGLNLPTFHTLADEDIRRIGQIVNEELSDLRAELSRQ
jgi:perosamine synthetase